MEQKKGVLIFDLDRTLFDTAALMRDNTELLRRHGILKKHERTAAHEPFHPKTFINALFETPAERKKMLSQFLGFLEKPERYWYRGTDPFLKKLKRDFTLILLTYGTKSFQQKKIGSFARFFDSVIITTHKDKEAPLRRIKSRYADCAQAFFDDKPVALAAARRLGIRAFKIKKSPKDAHYFDTLYKKILKLWT